ncbi:MAG: class B sortase [Eubacterium sp.]|nr:class B sortase [Eubacterium sp.]
MAETKKNKKGIILDILLVVFILIFVGTGGYLIYYYHTINKSEKGFSEVAGLINEDVSDSGDTFYARDGETIETKESTGEEYTGEKYVKVGDKLILARYKDIYEKNNDFAGWISIPDTPIDYPVMHTPKDPEFYLRRDFDKNYSIAGTIFIDERDDLEKPSDNIIIYGHHMKSGTMFGSLQKYEDEKYYRSHKLIYFDTLYERGTYEVIAAFRTQIYSDDYAGFVCYNFIDADNAEDFDDFVTSCKALTGFETGVSASYGDKLISLSTCSYHVDDGRFVVIAKKID